MRVQLLQLMWKWGGGGSQGWRGIFSGWGQTSYSTTPTYLYFNCSGPYSAEYVVRWRLNFFHISFILIMYVNQSVHHYISTISNTQVLQNVLRVIGCHLLLNVSCDFAARIVYISIDLNAMKFGFVFSWWDTLEE